MGWFRRVLMHILDEGDDRGDQSRYEPENVMRESRVVVVSPEGPRFGLSRDVSPEKYELDMKALFAVD